MWQCLFTVKNHFFLCLFTVKNQFIFTVFFKDLFIAGSGHVRCGCASFTVKNQPFYRWLGPRCDVAMPVLLSRTKLFSLVGATERCGNASFTVKNQPFYRWLRPRCDVAIPVLLSRTNLFITGSGHVQCASQVWGNADFTVARTNNVIADSGHVRCGNASFTTVERDRRVTMAR